MLPTISVIVSVLNSSKTLERCLRSFDAQTFPQKEIIIIDGGSTDGTRQILERNASKLTYWVSERDRGIYHAWNKALAHARGEWVCFLGADDFFWSNDVLARLSGYLANAYPAHRVVYGEVAMVNGAGKEVLRIAPPWEAAGVRFPQIMSLAHPGLMHHRTLFEEHGGFDESFQIAGDYELLLRELPRNKALFVPGVVVVGVMHGGVSATPSGRLKALHECRRAQRKNGRPLPGALWLWETSKARARLWLWRLLGPRRAAHVFDTLRAISGKPPYWTRQ